MKRILSSSRTFLIKWVLPVVWIVCGGVDLGMIWSRGVDPLLGTRPPASERLELLSLWGIGSVFLTWVGRQTKRVQVDERGLYVSNYWSELCVPFREISHFTERAWFVRRTVTIHLRHPSAVGDRILFVPKLRWVPFGPHPVIRELLKCCNATSLEGGNDSPPVCR